MEKRIQADMVSAMKEKNAVKLASLRAIKAAITLAKTAEGGSGEVTDQDIVKINDFILSACPIGILNGVPSIGVIWESWILIPTLEGCCTFSV